MTNSQNWANRMNISRHTVIYNAIWNDNKSRREWRQPTSPFCTAVTAAKMRQSQTRSKAFPYLVVYIRLSPRDANQTMPICAMDPRVCVVAPRLWAELNSYNALGLGKFADFTSYMSVFAKLNPSHCTKELYERSLLLTPIKTSRHYCCSC